MWSNEESFANGWAAHRESPDTPLRNPYDRELQYLSHHRFRNGWAARESVKRNDPAMVQRLDAQIIELAIGCAPASSTQALADTPSRGAEPGFSMAPGPMGEHFARKARDDWE